MVPFPIWTQFYSVKFLYPIVIDTLRIGYARQRYWFSMKFVFRMRSYDCVLFISFGVFFVIGFLFRSYMDGTMANVSDYSMTICAIYLGQQRISRNNYQRPSLVIMLLMFFLLVCVSYTTVSSNFISLLVNYDKAKIIENIRDAQDSNLDVLATDFIKSVSPSGYESIR